MAIPPAPQISQWDLGVLTSLRSLGSYRKGNLRGCWAVWALLTGPGCHDSPTDRVLNKTCLAVPEARSPRAGAAG